MPNIAQNSSSQLYTQTADLTLRHYDEADAIQLHEMSANSEVLHLWAPNSESMPFKKFKQKLERRIEHRWSHYLVIVRRSDNQIIGFAYCYNGVISSDLASVCICIEKPYMNSLICLRASYLYLAHLFVDHGYRKLYAEVFDYNTQCKNLLQKVGFEQEGQLKEHQIWKDQYWDLHIFSLTSKSYSYLCQKNLPLVERLSCKSQRN